MIIITIGTQVIATVDERFKSSTICHIRCAYLLAADGGRRCEACEQYRKSLHSMLARLETSGIDRTEPSSHVNHRYASMHLETSIEIIRDD